MCRDSWRLSSCWQRHHRQHWLRRRPVAARWSWGRKAASVTASPAALSFNPRHFRPDARRGRSHLRRPRGRIPMARRPTRSSSHRTSRCRQAYRALRIRRRVRGPCHIQIRTAVLDDQFRSHWRGLHVGAPFPESCEEPKECQSAHEADWHGVPWMEATHFLL